MKTTTKTYIFFLGIAAFLVACSTKKDTFIHRQNHRLSTKYNILYNGGNSLNQGVVDLRSQYKDNFWEILPVERMQVTEDKMLPGETKNPNFERAETKATKAIQKHSMNIDGSERNPQMDEAHLMLGQARYYEQRFVPALEAFNYVLYKYPQSDKINLVKIWREKTNMRLENDEMAVNNLRKLLKEIKFKDQVFADANATLAQAFINLKETDSAIAKLRIAIDFTELNEEKARYRFITGQLYEERGQLDSANVMYQQVIDMNRKAARQYVIQAHARQAKQFNPKNGDTIAFLEKFNDLLKDRENRPYLDVLNHQMGLFYDKVNKPEQAKKFYNKSLKSKPQDQYLIASNYRNLGEIYFNDAKYVTAGKYYDSTLTVLNPRTREFRLITKKKDNLKDVIKFEGIAQRNDSILKLAAMSPEAREAFFQKHIDNLKKQEAEMKAMMEKLAKEKAAIAANEEQGKDMKQGTVESKKAAIAPVSSSLESSSFYFYNATTVEMGKLEFVKKWGKRAYGENWRWSKGNTTKGANASEDPDKDSADNSEKDDTKTVNPQHTTAFYIKQLPTDAKVLDSLAKERNFAYYQLGVIYKEKFKEYKRASDKLEQLLKNNPEERLVLPSLYNLYKIYEIIEPSKAAAMKSRIISEYPDSRYAQILLGKTADDAIASSPEATYDGFYKEFEAGKYRELLPKTNQAIEQFTGEEMLPKFELLKAQLQGKLIGLAEYKKALNYVALTYPNSEEGKATEQFIQKKLPYLESLSFNSEPVTSWKIVYPIAFPETEAAKKLTVKLEKFVKERTIEKMTLSNDIYTMNRNFIVIHGIKNLDNAKGIGQVLKDFKEYKISEPYYILSSENYKVVQVMKNFEDYVSGDWLNKPIVPVQRNLEIEKEAPKVVEQGKNKGTVTKDELFAEDPAAPPIQGASTNAVDPKGSKSGGVNPTPSNSPKGNDNSPMNSLPPAPGYSPKK
ncbi:tetratricopeptide repeat protein [Flavobacterium sp. N1719]|uniref:type IX secretion system periplasmic lipoprotein PorW/SprE n=1 Tax=Flavobacterium sp. N1719 TaxID=2885633 RepID=UPI0022223C61|nr:tetratricopeptide repeat protein [Flavobacterium sp. N1719]